MTSRLNTKTAWILLTAVVIVIILLAIFLPSEPTGNSIDEREKIILGSIMPLSGDAAAYGIPLQKIANLAVEEINSAGGVNGKQLEIIFEDGKCSGKDASLAVNKLININGIKVILGGVCSGETLGAAPIAERNKVILLAPTSGSPDVTNAGDFIFRDFPSDATSGSKVAQAAIENSHNTIGILSEQTDYAQAVKNVFKETYENLKGTVLADETFVSENSDYRTQITKIKSSNVDAVYLVTQTPSKFGLALKQLKEMGLNQQIYGNEFAAAEDILKGYPSEIEGAIYAEPAFNENSFLAQNLINKVKLRWGDEAGSVPPFYWATTYDGVYILKESIEDCGGDEDTECIRDYLYSIKNRAGTAGVLTMDENGDPEFEYVLKVIRDNTPSDL